MTKSTLRQLLHPRAIDQLRTYVTELTSEARLIARLGAEPTALNLPHVLLGKISAMITKNVQFLNKADIDYFLRTTMFQSIDYDRLIAQPDFPRNRLGGGRIVEYCDSEKARGISLSAFNSLMRLPHEYRLIVPIMTMEYVIDTRESDAILREPVIVSDCISLFHLTPQDQHLHYLALEEIAGYTHPLTEFLYIGFRQFGCPHFSVTSSLYQRMVASLRLFLAGSIAEGLIFTNYEDKPKVDEPPNQDPMGYSDEWGPGYYYVYPKAIKERASLNAFPYREKNFLRSLSFDSYAFELSEIEETKVEKGKVRLAGIINQKLSYRLRNISKLFDGREDPTKERIKTALEWFLEGLMNENRTFSFILFAIALEALVGEEKEHLNIVDRISDRCAYLVASDSSQRRLIRENVKEAYRVRSRIVHTGNPSLKEEDLKYYTILREYLKKALAAELRNLPGPEAEAP